MQLKLLEIYSARKDKAGFGKVAEAFNKVTGGSGDNWIKAAALGYALDPANPMYAAGKDVVGVATPSGGGATDVDLDLGLGDTGTATDIALDAGPAAAGADTGILDLGGDDKAAAPAMPDFALDVPAADNKVEKVETAAPESNLMDFQIELPKSADEEPTRAAKPAAAAAAPADDGGLDFKLPSRRRAAAKRTGIGTTSRPSSIWPRRTRRWATRTAPRKSSRKSSRRATPSRKRRPRPCWTAWVSRQKAQIEPRQCELSRFCFYGCAET